MKPNRLLIVDDDVLICRTLEHIAQKAGFETISTDCATSFFLQLDLFDPSLIIIDLLLPDTTGIELIKRLAELKTKARIIVTSGQETRIIDDAAQQAKVHGMTVIGTLKKPFSAANLKYLLTLHMSHRDQASNSSEWQQTTVNPEWVPTLDEIIRVVENDEITLDYQPKLRCIDGAVLGFEALARWNVPGRGHITPSFFVPLAEHNHLYSEMTRNIARKGIAWLGLLNKSRENVNALTSAQVKGPFTLAFNITMNAIYDPHLPEQLVEFCQEHEVPVELITLEVSEPDSISNLEEFTGALNRYSMLGFQLSLDDYGTGHMAIRELINSPFTEVKVDQYLIRNGESSQKTLAVIKSCIDIGKNLGINVVAEGVETQSMLDFLNENGSYAFQGYLISKPLNGESIEKWLSEYE